MIFNRIPKVLYIVALAILPFIPGCVTAPDIADYPPVSFTNEVQPIIAGNCTQAGCHAAGNGEQGSLVTYEDIKAKITPGNARKSTLYKMITGRGFLEIMPPAPANSLTENQIRSIFVWIEQGANNN